SRPTGPAITSAAWRRRWGRTRPTRARFTSTGSGSRSRTGSAPRARAITSRLPISRVDASASPRRRWAWRARPPRSRSPTLGGAGYITDHGVERIYRAVRVAKIYEGTNDIQRLVISRALAGEDEQAVRHAATG